VEFKINYTHWAIWLKPYPNFTITCHYLCQSKI
jgi:hypothetical protein